jgi:beta-galactosidase GanA
MVRPGSVLSALLPYGGDDNPEQWWRETWDEDVCLMQEAGVT